MTDSRTPPKMLSTTVVAPIFVVNCEPTGPFRRVLFLAESLTNPCTALKIASRFAPRAQPRIIDGNCAPVPSIDPRKDRSASSLQSLRLEAPTCYAGVERPWPEPATFDPRHNNTDAVCADVETLRGDLLMVEDCRSEKERELAPHHAVRKVLADPPCDLLLIRGSGNSELGGAADGR